MTVSRADWDSSVPWRRLEVGFPLQHARGEIARIVAHRRGTFGWQYGDWVSKRPFGRQFRQVVDRVGLMNPKRKENPLKDTLCLAAFDGLVDYIGDDEDEQPSVGLRHSSIGKMRYRISFFGDLSELFVKKPGQRVKRGQPIGRPGRAPNGRHFTHFSIGYRPVEGVLRKEDYFVDPFSLIPGAKSAIP
jgi:hypothetical protein